MCMCLFVLGVTTTLQERSTAGWPEQDLFAGKSAMQGQQFHGAPGLRTLAQGTITSDTASCPIGKPSGSGAWEMRGSGACLERALAKLDRHGARVKADRLRERPQYKYQLQGHDCEWTLANCA